MWRRNGRLETRRQGGESKVRKRRRLMFRNDDGWICMNYDDSVA